MVLTLCVWGYQLVPLRRSRLSPNFHCLCSSYSFIKKACCCVPRTPGDIRSERTGVDLWAQDNPSASARKRQKMLWTYFSTILPRNSGRDGSHKSRSVLLFLIRNTGRRQGPGSRIKILVPEDRLALWAKVSSLLVFRENRLIAMGSRLPCTYCYEKRGIVPWAHVTTPYSFQVRRCCSYEWRLSFLFCSDKTALFVDHELHMCFCSQGLPRM